MSVKLKWPNVLFLWACWSAFGWAVEPLTGWHCATAILTALVAMFISKLGLIRDQR